MIDLYPSVTHFQFDLVYFFQRSTEWKLNNILPNKFYWSGNEVDIFSPFIFNYFCPSLTQKWVNYIMNKSYTSKPSGYYYFE